MTLLSREKITAYLWTYTEIPDSYEGKTSHFPLANSEKIKLLKEINWGIDSENSEDILRFVEYSTRDNFEELKIELKTVPEKTPRHLDNEKEFFGWPRISYNEITIRRDMHSYLRLDTLNTTAELHLTQEKAFEFFSRIYICSKIYATAWDNIIKIEKKETGLPDEIVDLVFWGVHKKNPVYY
jgi:hypothetical protein